MIDSVTFTNSVDELLFDINEAMIQYHEELMNWLEVLRTSDHDKINTTILSLQGQQENLFSELIKLFNQVNIPYEKNLLKYQNANNKKFGINLRKLDIKELGITHLLVQKDLVSGGRLIEDGLNF